MTTFLTWSGWIIGVVSFIYAVYTNIANGKMQKELLNKQQAQPFELIGMLGVSAQDKVITPYDFQEKVSSPYHITKLDIDHDGKEELLIQSTDGSYSCKLEIYQFSRNNNMSSLVLLDSVTVNTMSGYIFNDIDNDSFLEIITIDNSKKANKPYVMGFRDEVIFKFKNKKIIEISRIELYSQEDHVNFLKKFNDL
ncbi:VCBS repeat-containing protein [Neisseria brasiliensis]|uniref:VCBS repeat-containing protein n=1 Tax=Neisseria brasiliensis TaxID=2666100 RepID=A0A5Q3S2Q4_9NEIS|nr:VCBS repeat-containing protein [Neisseria brasiliensis]QGL26470.1 VCBS repeat-containing protein [Neisseria brasiliensis]